MRGRGPGGGGSRGGRAAASECRDGARVRRRIPPPHTRAHATPPIPAEMKKSRLTNEARCELQEQDSGIKQHRNRSGLATPCLCGTHRLGFFNLALHFHALDAHCAPCAVQWGRARQVPLSSAHTQTHTPTGEREKEGPRGGGRRNEPYRMALPQRARPFFPSSLWAACNGQKGTKGRSFPRPCQSKVRRRPRGPLPRCPSPLPPCVHSLFE